MTRKILLSTLSALTVGAMLASTVVPASARGFGGGHMSFADLDTNGDGVLSVEEMQAPMLERFQSADTDGDGNLSADELNAARPEKGEGKRFGGGKFGKNGGNRGDRAAKMIAKLEKSADRSKDPQLGKMRSLRQVLVETDKKLRLDTLLKCEDVLKKLYEKVEGPEAELPAGR